MFSSNQILEISGSINHKNEVYNALEFVLKAEGCLENFTRAEKPTKCVFQITKDGRFCIGWNCHDSLENGWTEFQFDFDLNIISQIIEKHLEKQEIEQGILDGSYQKGFIVKAIPESLGAEYDGIINPFYGIVEFKPYTCFYSK